MPKRVVEVRKWGNSKALVIPSDMFAQLGWKMKDLLHVSVERGALCFRPLQLPISNGAAVVSEGEPNADRR